MTMAPRKLQVGIVGLGRMGRRHAANLLERTFRADVVAAWAFDEREAEWGYEQLQPHGATIYTDYDNFLQHIGLEAVVIATVAGAHADQALKAIEQDKHVLCEKPLSISAEIVSSCPCSCVPILFADQLDNIIVSIRGRRSS